MVPVHIARDASIRFPFGNRKSFRPDLFNVKALVALIQTEYHFVLDFLNITAFATVEGIQKTGK